MRECTVLLQIVWNKNSPWHQLSQKSTFQDLHKTCYLNKLDVSCSHQLSLVNKQIFLNDFYMILPIMVANPESFRPQRELILECPDLHAFNTRPLNFRAVHYGFVSSPWGGNDCVRKKALGHFSWIQFLKTMSCLWPSIIRINVQRKGWTRGEDLSLPMFLNSCYLGHWKKGNSGLTTDYTTLSGFMEQSTGQNLPHQQDLWMKCNATKKFK